MSRSKRLGRLARLLIVGLLGCSLAPLFPAQPAAARNSVRIGDDSITITVPVEVFWWSRQISGEQLVRRWKQAVDKYWNQNLDGEHFQWCGKDVKFEFDIKLVPRGQYPSDDDRHNVFVPHLRPGQYARARVFYGRPQSQYEPTEHRAGGFWPDNKPDYMIAHEFGHFLGLDDEYEYWDMNGNGKRDNNEPTQPLPGKEGSLMADSSEGIVLQEHIDEIIRRHKIDQQLECALRIRHEGEFTWDGAYGDHTDVGRSFVSFEIVVEQAEDGQLQGQGRAIDLAHERELFFHPQGCVNADQQLSADASVPDFDVTGTRTGNTVKLVLPDDLGDNFLVDFYSHCSGNSEQLVLVLPYLREIEGELADGRFEETRLEEVPRPQWIPVNVRYYILIEEVARPKQESVG